MPLFWRFFEYWPRCSESQPCCFGSDSSALFLFDSCIQGVFNACYTLFLRSLLKISPIHVILAIGNRPLSGRTCLMRSFLCMLSLLTFALASCSEDSKDLVNPKSSPYSGSYSVTYPVSETNCAFYTPLAGNSRISIVEDKITWDDMKGEWDEETKHGTGKSTSPTCIPINPSIGCSGCLEMVFDIFFASVDSFYGTMDILYSFSPSCSTDSCHVLYSVTGSRINY